MIMYFWSFIETSDVSEEFESSIFPFKALNLFFNEPYLEGLKIRGSALEGAPVAKISKFIIDLIDSNMDDEKIIRSGLVNFSQKLSKGLEVLGMIRSTESQLNLSPTSSLAVNIQDYVLNEMLSHAGSTIILPFGWNGNDPHAICIQLERLVNDKFNVTVLNSGDGVSYHVMLPCQYFPSNDWRRIYPYTYKLWMEFVDIPLLEIFDETAWFFSGLIYMQSKELMRNAAKVNRTAHGSVADYFYGSFLVNFTDYLKPALSNSESTLFSRIQSEADNSLVNSAEWREIVKHFVPSQRSGSCSVSSLLAALQYSSTDDLKLYYRDKVILGHLIMKDFLLNHLQSGLFVDLLSDGSEAVARNLFKKLTFALALNLIRYLEETVPELKNTILLGADRHNLFEKLVNGGLTRIVFDPETLEFIDITTDYCMKISNILQGINFNPKSTSLTKTNQLSECTPKTIQNLTFPNINVKMSVPDIFRELKGLRQGRIYMEAISINTIADLLNIYDLVSLSTYDQILDAIEALPSDLSSQDLWSSVDPYVCMKIINGSIIIFRSFLSKNNNLQIYPFKSL